MPLASGVASSVSFLDDSCTSLNACLPVLGWLVISPLVSVLQSLPVHSSTLLSWRSAMPPPACSGLRSSIS